MPWRQGAAGNVQNDDQLTVIKIHGCVSAHLSMIDTLKQRRCGRSEHLIRLLDDLREGHWIYLGFSAADLEGDTHYLGLIEGAGGNQLSLIKVI